MNLVKCKETWHQGLKQHQKMDFHQGTFGPNMQTNYHEANTQMVSKR